jgi:hypothetical protein
MRRFDYNEPVKLVWHDLRSAKNKVEVRTKFCKLSDAVRVVVKDWAGQPAKHLDIIQRARGKKSITTYAKVKAIYERDDFPAK